MEFHDLLTGTSDRLLLEVADRPAGQGPLKHRQSFCCSCGRKSPLIGSSMRTDILILRRLRVTEHMRACRVVAPSGNLIESSCRPSHSPSGKAVDPRQKRRSPTQDHVIGIYIYI